jgi:general secretion pathway protein B
MSYILDALKRADAERERGHVPGLHSQSAAMLSARSHKVPPRPSRRARATAAVVLLLTAAAAPWWWSGTDQPPPAAAVPPPASAPDSRPADAPPAPMLAAPVAAPAPSPAPVLPILAPPVPAAPAARPVVEAAAPTAIAAPSPASATGPDSVRQQTDLPPEARAALPKLGVSGATYSANPEHRMLIVNGQVVREGQSIEPGLVLETILPRSAVFNHNGTRFNVNF